MTMHLGCTVHCGCMSMCNADQTRPDQTRPDPFFLSPLRDNTLLLLPQPQKAVHRLWKSAMRNGWADHNPTAVAAEQARRHPTPKETHDE